MGSAGCDSFTPSNTRLSSFDIPGCWKYFFVGVGISGCLRAVYPADYPTPLGIEGKWVDAFALATLETLGHTELLCSSYEPDRGHRGSNSTPGLEAKGIWDTETALINLGLFFESTLGLSGAA